MSRRISLTRIIALNWYGFRQIIDLDENILISGAFGTGKSALLDLVQYVLLGEHWKANRAASGNARGRDLVGYCLGDTNQVRNGKRHFLRQSGATLVALEFTRAGEKPKRETWGIRVQYSSPDAAPKHTYFFVPDRLDYSDLAPDGKQLLDDDFFRSWIRREYGNECLFSLQREYLAEMATARHLNFDDVAFHKTFPKAIAFEPEENVEKFIREFILEESPLDVREVRTALRSYDETRKRLERQENEAAYLRRIAEFHSVFTNSKREEAILKHFHHVLSCKQVEERKDRQKSELKRLETEHEDDLKQLQKAVAESKEIERLLSSTRFEIGKDPDAVKVAAMESEKTDLQRKVEGLREAQRSSRQRMDDRHYRWTQWLKHGAALPLDGLKDVLKIDENLLSTLRSGSDAERLSVLPNLAAAFNDLWRSIGLLVAPLQQEINHGQKRLQQLAEDIENISKGQAPGSFPLFQVLRHKLGNRVEQLGRLIEVKPEAERWWPALELFLGRNRWVIVPNDEYLYREALDILQKTPPGREPESLLNPSETRNLRGESHPNSLFTKVEIQHPIARVYVQRLLGDVICVESLDELEACESSRAITPEGIFKQAPLRRRLRPAASVELTLGREGLERMRQVKLREQEEVRLVLSGQKQRLSDAQAWLDNGQKGGLGDSTLPDRAAEMPLLDDWASKLRTLRETIALLMTPEREERQQRLLSLETQERALNQQVGSLNSRCQTFEQHASPLREALAAAESESQDSHIKLEESRVSLRRTFSGVLDSDISTRVEALRAEFPKWSACFDRLNQLTAEASNRAVEARNLRNREREKLAMDRDEHGFLRHPEYQHDHPIDDEDNTAWSNRLRDLEQVELEKSRQLAADRKKEWERRLEESVLNELNRRIQDAQGTIRLLDRYLSQPVRNYRYRISQRRDTAYSAIWSLLDTGLEPSDPLSAAIPEPDVQRAKEELMKAVDAPDDKDDRARRLLDYRNYHHYDIEMVPVDKPNAPPISLARSGRNLSGGESQAPYFISMLAAFRRVYDRGDRASTRSHQLGLVVMDEAFSKLSGDGIEDCLALARSFQLQLIMAFPPERLGVMVPHAQTVMMCQKNVERDAGGYVTRIDNIPHLTTMAEAMEALL